CVELRKLCEGDGWKGEGRDFDILGVMFEVKDEGGVVYELGKEMVEEVEMRDGEYDGLGDLGVRWYGVGIIGDMKLEIG
ncbi:nitric oxide synthase oxygenase, partial [Bacillus sp. WP8]|uniref:nitric oxide synthase oxygenase n=1 Tax=Bacillus sp. WP8 TaxID=756828 RepID=UPI001642C566